MTFVIYESTATSVSWSSSSQFPKHTGRCASYEEEDLVTSKKHCVCEDKNALNGAEDVSSSVFAVSSSCIVSNLSWIWSLDTWSKRAGATEENGFLHEFLEACFMVIDWETRGGCRLTGKTGADNWVSAISGIWTAILVLRGEGGGLAIFTCLVGIYRSRLK